LKEKKLLHWVSSVSLLISGASFVLFVIFLLTLKGGAAFGSVKQQSEAEGLAKAVEAVEKLVGSFDKAGPVALCLTSSIVFMIISLIAARS
jgi:hypothetical protein